MLDSIGPGIEWMIWRAWKWDIGGAPASGAAILSSCGRVLPVWASMCERMVDPHVALNARAAGVVLSLVAGAKRLDGREWRTDALGASYLPNNCGWIAL